MWGWRLRCVSRSFTAVTGARSLLETEPHLSGASAQAPLASRAGLPGEPRLRGTAPGGSVVLALPKEDRAPVDPVVKTRSMKYAVGLDAGGHAAAAYGVKVVPSF